MDFGLFYKIDNIFENATVLISILIYMPIENYSNDAVSSTFPDMNFNYENTSGKACYGGLLTQ